MIGRIYQITHKTLPIYYVGSTVQTLRRRWAVHKCAFRAWNKGSSKGTISIYPHMQTHGEDQFVILLLKEYDIADNSHLRAYEQLWINKITTINVLNSFNPLYFHLKRANAIEYYQNTQRWICGCGSTISTITYRWHIQGKKHQKYVDSMNRKKREATSNSYQTIDQLMEKLSVCKLTS